MNETLINSSSGSLNSSSLVLAQGTGHFSLLNFLPHTSFTNALIAINTQMSSAIENFLPHKWFLMPLIYDPLATLFVSLVIIMVFTFFMDFLADAWKIPFAIVVDIIDVMAIAHPFFNLYSAIGSVLVFSLLTRDCSKFWRYGFIAGGLFKAFNPALALFPLNTIMMFIATVVDD